jgi:hypothetical protein
VRQLQYVYVVQALESTPRFGVVVNMCSLGLWLLGFICLEATTPSIG